MLPHPRLVRDWLRDGGQASVVVYGAHAVSTEDDDDANQLNLAGVLSLLAFGAMLGV